MPPLKIIALASLLTLAIAAPQAFAQGGDNTPPPSRSAPTTSPTPGDSKTAPGDQQRGARKKGTKKRGADSTKQAPSPSAPSTTPN